MSSTKLLLSDGDDKIKYYVISQRPDEEEFDPICKILTFQKITRDGQIIGIKLIGNSFKLDVFKKSKIVPEDIPIIIHEDSSEEMTVPLSGLPPNIEELCGDIPLLLYCILNVPDFKLLVESLTKHISEKRQRIKGDEGRRVIERYRRFIPSV